MKQTVKELVQRKKNELHEGVAVVVPPPDQFIVERDRLIASESRSAEEQLNPLTARYQRLAWEYEMLYMNVGEAE